LISVAIVFIFSCPTAGVWLMVLLTPIEAVGPVSFTASKAAKLVLALLVAAALLSSVRDDKPWMRSPYFWPFGLMLVSGLISSLLAKSAGTSLLGLVSIAIFVLCYTA